MLVGRDGGGHALAGVAVAVDESHAELRQRAEEGQFFRADLPGANPRDGLRSMLVHDRPEAQREDLHRLVPIHGREFAAGVAEQRRDRAIR